MNTACGTDSIFGLVSLSLRNAGFALYVTQQFHCISLTYHGALLKHHKYRFV
jgi:hypothetical protein